MTKYVSMMILDDLYWKHSEISEFSTDEELDSKIGIIKL